MSSARWARVAAIRSRISSVAASKPPPASISVNSDHACCARLSVKSSMNHEPPPGSSTRATCDSSMSSS
ncbi:Uncharacterised protein [Mycobacteroides abscessus subsp. abscessus]|nr:Uncharacterised protein [Mycobacteroides abscessus subsp. abscessus]